MKKYLALLILPLVFFVASCTDSTTDPVEQKGSVLIQSNPAGAKIFLAGVDQGKVTPETLTDLTTGAHQVTLKLDGYNDTTFTVTVTANTTVNWSSINLTPMTATYGPIQIWETSGTSAAQPSGLDLSSGNAYGIGSSSANRTAVDIYYTSNGFVVTSADNATGLTRKTYFKVGGGSVLTDGVASSVKDNTWTDRMTDRQTNYVYLYDADMHYTKIIIDSYGGGNPNDPAWVKVKWIYNQAKDDVRFK
ncbi:MAG: PEGA domain-containing protein [Ignavibacteriaceae bacterium]|jgi:hypothetical protein|nr:PEGA domain-containing protein [Ignavibacteriaceae bacterium]